MEHNLDTLVEIKDLRTIWPHEATDFTPWLGNEENISLLGDTVGLEISVGETESAVGDFNVDIFATETGTGRRIIIENQLEDTDHDHLGKLITYTAGKDASIIIWIVKHAREEHRAAIEWLNNNTGDEISFFLLEVKLFKIGNSKPAVKFEVIEKPNDWTKTVRQADALTETEQLRLEYWNAFNDFAFTDDDFSGAFSKKKATHDHWMSFSIGSSEYHLNILQVRSRKRLTVEFYISDNKDLYHEAFRHKEDIERLAGMKFDWRELPEKKASRVLIEKAVNFEKRDEWQKQFRWAMDTLIKMKNAFLTYL